MAGAVGGVVLGGASPSSSTPSKLPTLHQGQVQVQAGTIAGLQAVMEKQKLQLQQQPIVIGAKVSQPSLKPLAAANLQPPLANSISSSSPSPKTSFADMKLGKLGPAGSATVQPTAPPTPAGGKRNKGKAKGADDKQEAIE